MEVEKGKNERKASAVKKADKPIRSGPLCGFEIAFTGAYEEYDRDRIVEVC